MNAVTEGWPLVKLGDVAETALGKMLDKGRPQSLPKVHYLRNLNVQWGHIDTQNLLTMELSDEERHRFAVEPGDLLVCEGGEIGRAAIWRGHSDYIAYQKALHRIRSKGQLDLTFLRYLLELYRNNGTLARFATGSTIAHLPQQKLRALPIPLPPVRRQQRVVELLEEILSRLDATGSLLSSTKLRFSPLVTSVLQGAIPLPPPQHWTVTSVGAAGTVDLGRQRHPDWHTGPEMRAYLRVANVLEDRIDTTDLKQMDFSGIFERYKLQPGDVLLNEGQSPEYLGRPAIYRGTPPSVAFTNSLIRFRARADVAPDWALLVFRRHMRSGRFAQESRITTNIAHLSIGRLRAVEFPIPPLAEQERIVAMTSARLTEIDASRSAVKVAQRHSSVLRQAVLTAAFSGKLTGRETDIEMVEEMAGA